MKDIIEKIHVSNIFGVFVETGCGVALTNKLMEVPGASNTIYMMESPYNKDYQQNKYHTEGMRAVSIDTVKSILMFHRAKIGISGERYKINTLYAASFQIGDLENDVATHGYIGIVYNNAAMIFHVSIHDRLSRKEYLEAIGNIGVQLLYSYTLSASVLADPLDISVPHDCNVDAAYRVNLEDNTVSAVPFYRMFQMLGKSKNENFICIDENGKFKRLDEFFRSKDKITLYKGSFNPPHIGHIEFAEIAEAKLNDKPVFMISQEIYQKDPVSAGDMEIRVRNLNKLGYRVIVSKSGFFNENIAYIRKKFADKQILFILGTDTINRIFESTYKVIGNANPSPHINLFKAEFVNSRFFVIDREGFPLAEDLRHKQFITYYEFIPARMNISSTKIRELRDSGQIDEANKFLPDVLKIKTDTK